MDDSDSSSDDNDHTPKRKGSRKRSGFDDSPISNVSFGSESPVVPWDFPRPKVSKKVKEAAKELGQMMNQVCQLKRKRQKFIERPEIPIDPLSSPVSRYQNSYSPTSFIDKCESSIDFEALEKIDLGRLDSSRCLNSSLSSNDRPTARKPRTSINLPTLNFHKKFRFNDDKSSKTQLISDLASPFIERPKNQFEDENKKTTESEPVNSKKGKLSEQWVSKTGINASTKSKFDVSTKLVDSEKSQTATSAQNINENAHSQVQLKEDLQKPIQPKVASVEELLEEDMCFFLTPELASL